MSPATSLLGPVIALALWTHVIMLWMYATRIPAIFAAKMEFDSTAVRGVQMSSLPARVRWKSDNFTHLTEQPTVFYAVAICLCLLDQASAFNLGLAWGYVGLRVIHSHVQVLGNNIPTRFTVFVTSSVVLIILTVNAALAVF
ncbi:MAG: MAPEG family protein [Myxococcota bacterium]